MRPRRGSRSRYQHVSLLCVVHRTIRIHILTVISCSIWRKSPSCVNSFPMAETGDRNFFGTEAVERLPWLQANRRLYEISFNAITARTTQNDK